MRQRTNDPVEKIIMELAELRRRLQALETQESGVTGVTDHTALTNIGTNSHTAIDTALATAAAHISATTAHGVTGDIVGTGGAQTLTGQKTLAAPIFTGDALIKGELIAERGDLTIASDAITVTKTYHRVDTQSAAATDDLSTISGMVNGQIVVLTSVASARDVTIKHGVGNIFLADQTDFVLGNSRDHIVLICTGGEINEISRSQNSVTPWANLSLTAGWANFGSGFRAGQYRRIGDTVSLRGLVLRNTGTNATLATLLPGFRPLEEEIFAVGSASAFGEVRVTATGNVNLQTGTPSAWVSLSPIAFSVV